ncbi:MAG: ABC transporter ATP-binding protein [Suilimivivens sp.]
MLEIKDVMYYYKSQKDKVILNHISYSFEEGKMYAVLGASGSGKTTLLSLLAGLDVPVEGAICMNGVNIMQKGLNAHRKENISLVFQNYNLIDYLTPVENVRLGGKADAMGLLKSMGLDETQSKRNVMQLSGGQQQRVAIARALASNAPVLLADEPTGNLDEDTANEIIDIFSNLAHEKSKCVIMVTHSKELAQKADVILTLKKGTVVRTEDTEFDEKIRKGLMEQAERFSAPDDLKDRIMQKIEKQSN